MTIKEKFEAKLKARRLEILLGVNRKPWVPTEPEEEN
jgi:hypothetical protein